MKKTFFFGLLLCLLLPCTNAQDTLPPPPMRDSLVLEYYFCWAKEWDDTIYYTQMIEVYQDTLTSKKLKIDTDFKHFMHQDLNLSNDYAGFTDGPFYDSASFMLYFDYWVSDIADTIPSKEVFFLPDE
jgi:hypothetical protein